MVYTNFNYPAEFERDEDGRHVVTFPDFGWGATDGATRIARQLNVAETEVRRMLNPDHATKAAAIERALWHLGKHVSLAVGAVPLKTLTAFEDDHVEILEEDHINRPRLATS